MTKTRINILATTLTLSFLLVLGRLFYWQIIKSSELSKQVTLQSYKLNLLSPNRGLILSSDKFPLALNQTKYQLSIYKPNLTQPIGDVITAINVQSTSFVTENQKLIDNFTNNPNQKWITFPQFFTPQNIDSLTLPGITFSQTNIRLYPESELGKNIIGFLAHHNGKIQGISGLEGYYQKQLSGRAGFVWESKDATGKTVLSQKRQYYPAIDGQTLQTSINRSVQYYSEKILREGVEQYTADSGSVIIMEPKTGAILAMSTIYQPEIASTSSTKNANIADLFEPGSIFKPLIVSMGLDQKIITPDYICSDCDRPRVIGQYTINNWDNSTHPQSLLKDIIKNSDNIGMSGLISQIGLSNFLKYYELLGLNKKTGIDLLGEAKPPYKDTWPEIDLATASFGQGFAVSQIGMLNAFNSLANGGYLVKPHLVSTTKNLTNTLIFNSTTIKDINQILKYAVENGAVANFKPKNIEVCGKSGTAQIAVKGTYTTDSTIASYIGYSPCFNPKFTMIVTINNPKTSPWGSSTAAPIWFKLADIITPLI